MKLRPCGALFLALALSLCVLPAAAAPAAAPTAYARTQVILVDDREVTFEAYALKDEAGNETNYVKLRDLALVLSGSISQFSVEWDGEVKLKTGALYVPNGSELNTPYTGDQPYAAGPKETHVNGAAQPLSCIVLSDAKGNGYTYYKLRDLGTALNIYVGWNGKNVTIETIDPPGMG